jgi:hypothetical protein
VKDYLSQRERCANGKNHIYAGKGLCLDTRSNIHDVHDVHRSKWRLFLRHVVGRGRTGSGPYFSIRDLSLSLSAWNW